MIKILIVDDQPFIRKGLGMRLALEPDLVVVGETSDGMQALEVVRELQPDVVIMDVEMPVMDGITTAAKLLELYPQTVVIILSIHDTSDLRMRAKAAGVTAFVEKRGGVVALLQEIRGAVRNQL